MQLDCAVLGITHFSKNTSGRVNILHAVMPALIVWA